MNKVFYAPYLMLTLALFGIAIAFYDAYAVYNGSALWCPPPIDGCNEVASSPYARIFNLPVGYFGVIYYLYMFGLAAVLAFDPISRGLRYAALAYAAFCIYCLASAVATLLLFIAAISHFRTTLTSV
ncbi:MAG: vitamin K epoxide reductase family protein [Xanthobacteraceae bacterium]